MADNSEKPKQGFWEEFEVHQWYDCSFIVQFIGDIIFFHKEIREYFVVQFIFTSVLLYILSDKTSS